jgi:hypothetical protein
LSAAAWTVVLLALSKALTLFSDVLVGCAGCGHACVPCCGGNGMPSAAVCSMALRHAGLHSCFVPYVLRPIGLRASPHSGHLSMRAPFSTAAAKAGLMLVTKSCSKSCIMSNKAWAAVGRSLAACCAALSSLTAGCSMPRPLYSVQLVGQHE